MKQFWNPVTLYTFLKSKHTSGKLLNNIIPDGVFITENFCWREVLEHQTELPSLNILINLFAVINVLQVLRGLYFNNAPITINSAWRSEKYNAKIGGESNSKHTLGQALDIVVTGFTPNQVQKLLKNFSGGLGSYKNFTHIDISTKRRWNG